MKSCIRCGSFKTYVYKNGREEWIKKEEGFLCRYCYSKEYNNRLEVRNRKQLYRKIYRQNPEVQERERKNSKEYQRKKRKLTKKLRKNAREEYLKTISPEELLKEVGYPIESNEKKSSAKNNDI